MRHIIYIIEELAGFEPPKDFLEAINTAISSTQTVDNFFIKRVKHIEETISYLKGISNMLSKLYQVCTLSL